MAAFILDNGAYTAKAGFANQEEPRIIPNCITKAKSERRRQFIGDQIDDCKDVSGLFYILPFQKGYLTNWDVEKTVWDYIFGRDVFQLNFSEVCMVVTEPYFNFLSIQEVMNEVFYEEYQVESLLRINAGTLSAHHFQKQYENELCCLIVDSGYSFTHIVPYCKGKKLKNAIRRIDVGGKVLTNHLKEIISYRQLHVMDETYVMNQVKEDVCYVSTQFYEDMEIGRIKGEGNTIVRDYVLPDYTVIKRGYVKSQEESTGKPVGTEQIIRMNNERFSVPELLFHPSDIGIQQMGLPEAIIHSVEATPEEMQPHFYKNIILTGGNTVIPGFRERVYKEVRALASLEYDINVILPKNPITYAWEGGTLLSKNPEFHKLLITRKQYEENGHYMCQEKFDT